MPEAVATTKREKKFVAQGRAKATAAIRERRKSEALMDKGLLYGGAYAGQMFLGGMATPMLPTIPLAYSVGAVYTILELGGSVGRTRSGRAICALVDGYVAGELGVRGRANARPLFGIEFGAS